MSPIPQRAYREARLVARRAFGLRGGVVTGVAWRSSLGRALPLMGMEHFTNGGEIRVWLGNIAKVDFVQNQTLKAIKSICGTGGREFKSRRADQ